jgi:AraC-type DNA-binding domain-containing proteins
MLGLFRGRRGRRRKPEHCNAVYGEAFFCGIMERVDSLMREEKYYLDSRISLSHLVRITGTNRTYLSRAIFHSCGAHFCDYVNGWRVREVIAKIKTLADDVSLYEVALACGFNHRRTFYRAFVRETGIPPLDFMKRQESEEWDVLVKDVL